MAAWKKGRGKLGVLIPLLGEWHAEAPSPRGPVRCTRRFERTLGGTHVHLRALWCLEEGAYEDLTFFGCDPAGTLRFWSFTSDGKQSTGALADVTEVHPHAFGFEAQMPAGRARQAYWPAEDGGFLWAVEAWTKHSWRRMIEHHYRPAASMSTSDA